MIIVALPYHDNKRYAMDAMYDWVRDAELDDAEVVMRWHRGPFGEQDAVKKQREFFRLLTLERGATHMFSLDFDTVPPLDALPRLLSRNLPIVAGTYYGRFDGSGQVPGMGCTLIAREVLEKVSWLDWAIKDDDYPFYDKAKQHGYEVVFDPDVVCRHYEDAQTFF